MGLDQAILGSGLDISGNPKKILAQAALRIGINFIAENTGGASMFWGDVMQGIVREAFSLVPETAYAAATLSSGKTTDEITELGVDKAFSDAGFVRLAQKLSATGPDAGSSPQLVQWATHIIMELVETDEINEEEPVLKQAFTAVEDVFEGIEAIGDAIHSLPTDIEKLPAKLDREAAEMINEYKEETLEFGRDVSEFLDIGGHVKDVIDETGNFLSKRIDVTASALNFAEAVYASGAAVITVPLDYLDDLTDWASDEFDSVIDVIYLRNASRGR